MTPLIWAYALGLQNEAAQVDVGDLGADNGMFLVHQVRMKEAAISLPFLVDIFHLGTASGIEEVEAIIEIIDIDQLVMSHL